jgi:hypothetical protein
MFFATFNTTQHICCRAESIYERHYGIKVKCSALLRSIPAPVCERQLTVVRVGEEVRRQTHQHHCAISTHHYGSALPAKVRELGQDEHHEGGGHRPLHVAVGDEPTHALKVGVEWVHGGVCVCVCVCEQCL